MAEPIVLVKPYRYGLVTVGQTGGQWPSLRDRILLDGLGNEKLDLMVWGIEPALLDWLWQHQERMVSLVVGVGERTLTGQVSADGQAIDPKRLKDSLAGASTTKSRSSG